MSVSQTVENVYLRQNAVQLARKHLWRLLGMLAITLALPALLEQLLTWLGDLLLLPETTALLSVAEQYATSETITSAAPVSEALASLFTSPKFLLWNLFYGMATGILSEGLLLGQRAELLRAGRGETPRVAGVFRRMRHCVRAWGLNVWMALKTFFWALPGIFVMLLGAEIAAYSSEGLGSVLMMGGLVLTIVLCVMAYFRYVLAPQLLADEPDRGIRDCVRFSAALMKGHKRQYFRCMFPLAAKVLGIMWLVMEVGLLLLDAFGLGTSPAAQWLPAAGFAAALYFFLQTDAAQALFYLKRRESERLSVQVLMHDSAGTVAESPDSPADAMEAQPENTSPETNEEKENPHE